MENLEFQIKKLGTLKYSRLKSLSILRKEINSYDYNYTMSEIKELLDSILNNTLEERFNLTFKVCFDKIFNNNDFLLKFSTEMLIRMMNETLTHNGCKYEK